ncbi:hypothetical protein ABR737_43450 [Streptomyces sp. Edi2]|uniref:hypothetical protein n=1 Tax=Streptomyces sp. Edi2 TaxID=3162528 RepID=UPI0033064DD8
MTMPEDPIAQSEIAALTRRHEDGQAQNAREFGIIKSELTTLQLKVSNLDQKLDTFIAEQREANAEQRRTNAILVELLSKQVGKDPDAAE